VADPDLQPVLLRMSEPQRMALGSVLGLHDPKQPEEATFSHAIAAAKGKGGIPFARLSRSEQVDELEAELSSAGGHTIANLFRGGEGVSYREVVGDVAEELKVALPPQWEVQSAEALIVQAVLSKWIGGLTADQRQDLVARLENIAAEHGNPIGVAGGALLVLTTAQLSGFGVYLAASTVVGGLTGLLGLTLPFAFYAGMSKVVSILIGPVGWGALAVGWLGAPSMKKLLPSVVMVAAARNAPADGIGDRLVPLDGPPSEEGVGRAQLS